MKSCSLAFVATFLLAGCAHQASYDSLGGYDSSYSSYSVGVSSGYPAYGYGYAPVYSPYYVPGYGGHRHYHDGHRYHNDHGHNGRHEGGKHHHDGGGKKGDRPHNPPRPDARPPSRPDKASSRDHGVSPASNRRADGSLRSERR